MTLPTRGSEVMQIGPVDADMAVMAIQIVDLWAEKVGTSCRITNQPAVRSQREGKRAAFRISAYLALLFKRKQVVAAHHPRRPGATPLWAAIGSRKTQLQEQGASSVSRESSSKTVTDAAGKRSAASRDKYATLMTTT